MPVNGKRKLSSGRVTKVVNIWLLRDGKLEWQSLWICNGVVINDEERFWQDRLSSWDELIDGRGCVCAPGFIDLQLNGAWGVDFSLPSDDVASGVALVASKLPAHGVTSFCPTIISSAPSVYAKQLPQLKPKQGGAHGSTVLGVHLEGPFITNLGAHRPEHARKLNPELPLMDQLHECYSKHMDDVDIITIAPEIPGVVSLIPELVRRGIVVSMGHTRCTLVEAESAVTAGARWITHLFNAMPKFHHRDPGLVGLLGSHQSDLVKFGIICDGIHTNAASAKIAHKAHPRGTVLVTDAMSAMGLGQGQHVLGDVTVVASETDVRVLGSDTLAGAIASMDSCVRNFLEFSDCSLVEALDAASAQPAGLLNLKSKGHLNIGADADFVLLDRKLKVRATYVAGEKVFEDWPAQSAESDKTTWVRDWPAAPPGWQIVGDTELL